MESPFPGMDPYIEASRLWPDFHQQLIGEIQRTIAGLLPPRYVARLTTRAYVVLTHSEGKEAHLFQPDVGVTGPPPDARAKAVGGAATATEVASETEAVVMRAFIAEQYRESFLEIYIQDEGERILVTTIEILSPSNKRAGTPGWDLYLRKRQGLLLGEANLVEIDLLRGGSRMPMLDPWPASPYTLLVARRTRTTCKVWPAHFKRPLPVLQVPLVAPDPDVALDLQPMVAAVYERGRYFLDIDYTRPLDPPLGPDDTGWLAEQLAARPAG